MYATRTRKVKTDRRDARALAEACVLGAYRPAHRLSDPQRHVRGRLLVRDALVHTRTRYISLIRALLRQQGYRVPSGSAEAFATRVRALALPGACASRTWGRSSGRRHSERLLNPKSGRGPARPREGVRRALCRLLDDPQLFCLRGGARVGHRGPVRTGRRQALRRLRALPGGHCSRSTIGGCRADSTAMCSTRPSPRCRPLPRCGATGSHGSWEARTWTWRSGTSATSPSMMTPRCGRCSATICWRSWSGAGSACHRLP